MYPRLAVVKSPLDPAAADGTSHMLRMFLFIDFWAAVTETLEDFSGTGSNNEAKISTPKQQPEEGTDKDKL